MHTARRTHGFTESVIRGMTRLANEHGAINLAQGFPNFPAPDALKDAAARAIRDDINQYAITWGAKRLRDALARKYAEWYGMTVDPETEVTITCGATEAMASAMLAVVDPGDEVIVFEPLYENYGPDTILCGDPPVYVPPAARHPLALHRRGAAARGHRGRPRDAGPRLLPGPRRPVPDPTRPAVRGAPRRRLPLHAARGRVLHPRRFLTALRPARRRIRPLAHVRGGCRAGAGPEFLQPPRTGAAPGAVRVL